MLAPHGRFYVPSLDGIRATAALLVFVGHAVPPEMSRMIPRGFGVTVFFILSGYLIITTSFEARIANVLPDPRKPRRRHGRCREDRPIGRRRRNSAGCPTRAGHSDLQGGA